MTTSALTDIHIKIDAGVKEDAEAVLKEIGLSMSNYLNMSLRQLCRQREIPFRATAKGSLPGTDIKTKEEFDAFIEKRLAAAKNSPSYTGDEARAELRRSLGVKI